jgi:regulator of sigma E protease
MDVLISIVSFLIIIAILVVLHEMGHFFSARFFGVGVEEFAFGIPPRLWARKKGETVYAINAIPVGGYVRMVGEEEDVGDNPKSFQNKKPWQRLIILLAGSISHFVLAIVIFAVLAITLGKAVSDGTVNIDSVSNASPANAAGLGSGDRILAVDGVTFNAVDDFLQYISDKKGQSVDLTIEKKGEATSQQISIVPRENPPAGEGPLGVAVQSGYNTEKVSLVEGVRSGFITVGIVVKATIDGLGTLLSSLFNHATIPAGISGPVGMASLSGQVVKNQGILGLVFFLGLLAANLAVFNLLPFPALDGGRIIFVLIELLTRKRVPLDKEAWVHAVGIGLLLMLIAFVTLKDIVQLFKM